MYTSLLEKEAQSFIELILDILPAFAAVGVIAMVAVELIKLLPFRRVLHRKLFLEHFPDDKNGNSLMSYFSSGMGNAFFSQKPVEITTQVASMIQYFLSYPSSENESLIKLAANALVSSDNEQVNNSVGDLIKNYEPTDMTKMQEYDKQKEFLTELVNLKLILYKTRMEYWWARILQSFSIAVSSILIFFFLLPSTQFEGNNDTINPIMLFFFVIFGGLVAPFSHDLISKINARQTM